MNWTKYHGQNYLIDYDIVTKIISSSNIKSDEHVCEMGSGKGILTVVLCQNAKSVTAFEIDKRLFKETRNLTYIYKNLELVNEDILKYSKPLNFNIFVSNIPYSRSKKIFLWLATKKFDRAILMVQKEFSEKIRAKVGDRNYRAISVITQYCFDIKLLFRVGRKSFLPEPKVESEVILLVSKNKFLTRKIIDKLQYIFSFKNKKIHKINKKTNCFFEPDELRIKDLDPDDIVSFAEMMISR